MEQETPLLETYSQINQDRHVVNFYDGRQNGYFVEIGANDGIDLSNTYLLEKKYGWKGVCIEPLKEAYNKLVKNRSAICSDRAVFSKSGLTLQFSQCNLYSGITEYIDKYTDVKDNEMSNVVTSTLTDLLDENDAPKFIEYMSIDTEGSELEILKGVDFDKYTFGIINLEHNYIEPRRTLMRELLVSKGYFYAGENHWDDNYVHKSFVEGVYYYDGNYNKPIEIKQVGHTKNITVKSDYWDDDVGVVVGDSFSIQWNRLGRGKIYHNYIDYGHGNVWSKKLKI